MVPLAMTRLLLVILSFAVLEQYCGFSCSSVETVLVPVTVASLKLGH